MYKDKNFKYQYFSNGKNKVIATSTYAGKRVRGVAKCSEDDVFDVEIGKRIAAARCNVKIANKRYKQAQKKYAEATKKLAVIEDYFKSMCDYLTDSATAKDNAKVELENIMKEVN